MCSSFESLISGKSCFRLLFFFYFIFYFFVERERKKKLSCCLTGNRWILSRHNGEDRELGILLFFCLLTGRSLLHKIIKMAAFW